jgi:GT2 family glycosyltransferase
VPEGYAAEAAARVGEGWKFANLRRFLFYLAAYETGRVFATGCLRPAKANVVQNLHGGSIVADRAAYAAIGGFDESFIGWGGEDNDFWDRAATTGRIYDYGYLPMIHLHHEEQPGKRTRDTAAIARYEALEAVPPRERIARLLAEKKR